MLREKQININKGE